MVSGATILLRITFRVLLRRSFSLNFNPQAHTTNHINCYAPNLTCRLVLKAQSTERRWQRFMSNARIQVEALPLVMAALSGWQKSGSIWHTTVLWDRYCMIHYRSSAADERSLLWRVLEHNSAIVASTRILQRAGYCAVTRM